MSCDVVKTKSKLKEIIFNCFHVIVVSTILAFNSSTIKKIYTFSTYNSLTPITVKKLKVKKSKAYILATSHLSPSTPDVCEKIPYYEIKPNDCLKEVENSIKGQITTAYLNKKNGKIIIFKRFPFKGTIYCSLSLLTYCLTFQLLRALRKKSQAS